MRVVYLIVAFMAFGLSIVAGALVFIGSSAFVCLAALLSAVMVTRRERRLASLMSSEQRGQGASREW